MTRRFPRVLAWTVGAALLWVVAGAIDRTTDLEIFSDGGRLQVEVAETELSAPAVLQSIETIEIRKSLPEFRKNLDR